MRTVGDNPEFSFDGVSRPELADYNENSVYTGIDFAEYDPADIGFENCRFVSCRFPGLSLSGVSFCTCVFEGCEFTLTKFAGATLNGVSFSGCKLVGVNLSDCSDFGLSPEFRDSILDSVVAFGKSLRKLPIVDCRLKDCDFTEMDFKEADFSGSEFEAVAFHNCALEKADFRTARGYEIDPASNRIRGLRCSLPEAQSFLGFLGIRVER